KRFDLIQGLIIAGFVLLLLIGAGFTGVHTYSLYYKGLGGNVTASIAAIIPVALIEGVTLLTFAGLFFYFKTEDQKFWGNIGGWGGVIFLAVNTMINHNTNTQHDVPYALSVYAWFMLPVVPVVSLAYIKHILALDPSIKRRQQEAELENTLDDMLMEAEIEIYEHPDVKRALADHKNDLAGALSYRIRNRIGYAKVAAVADITGGQIVDGKATSVPAASTSNVASGDATSPAEVSSPVVGGDPSKS
nr:hypothetical protein [Candidatus Saccharibacteria bacterium]